MVSKKILGVAIAAAFSAQAFAAIDGTAANNVTFAKETVLTTDISAAAPTTGLLNVISAAAANATTAGALTLQAPLGWGVSAGSHAWVRFDLTNAKFNNAILAADLFSTNIPGANITVAQGGAAGDTYVIFDVTAPAGGLSQSELLNFTPGQTTNGVFKGQLAVSTSAPVSVTVNHYSTALAASQNSGYLATKTLGSAITVAEALKTTITPNDLVASVNAVPVFTQFTAGAGAQSLGTIKFDLNAGYLRPSTGAAITALGSLLDTAATKSSITLNGDLSFTLDSSAANTAANTKFNAINSVTGATNVATGKLDDLSAIAAANTFTYNVTVNPKSAINAATYTLAFAPTAIASAQFGASGKTATFGAITRNGATVQVPYLTTNAGLNQKVILVNRSSADTTYSTTFTAENGVTATAGAKAAGTLKAKETLVLKATDLVTLTNGSRTAATIVALAPNTVIDAATQTVVTDPASVSFGSNDTVNLDVK